MATEGIEIKGANIVLKRLKNITTQSLEILRDSLGIAQTIVVNDAKTNHPGKGTPALRGENRARDSIMGTPRYADQTGALTQSIQPGTIKTSIDSMDAQVVAGSGSGFSAVEYAPYVEFGTSRMVAFPFLRPALIRQKEKIIKTIANYLQVALRKGGK